MKITQIISWLLMVSGLCCLARQGWLARNKDNEGIFVLLFALGSLIVFCWRYSLAYYYLVAAGLLLLFFWVLVYFKNSFKNFFEYSLRL